MQSRTRTNTIRLVIAFVVIGAAWQLIALSLAGRIANSELVMPTLGTVVTVDFPAISNYYSGSFGGLPPSQGGEISITNALLAIAENLLYSLPRVIAGLTIGLLGGVLLAFACTANETIRNFTLGLANSLRMLPLLALAPLFTLWFGAESSASIVFIAFAVGLVMLFFTINAVSTLPKEFEEYARTLGATRWQRLTRVVWPAIMPELRNALMISIPLAWGVLLASELFGIQNGLGWMMGEALSFSLVGRTLIIALIFALVIFVFLAVVRAIFDRVTRWAP